MRLSLPNIHLNDIVYFIVNWQYTSYCIFCSLQWGTLVGMYRLCLTFGNEFSSLNLSDCQYWIVTIRLSHQSETYLPDLFCSYQHYCHNLDKMGGTCDIVIYMTKYTISRIEYSCNITEIHRCISKYKYVKYRQEEITLN